MRKNKILIAVLLYVAILAFVPTISAAGYPVPVQFFYVPIPEDQHLIALKTIESGGSGTDPAEPMQSYISISAIADNTIIYYDQYENGFESDIGNPVNIYTSANTGGTQIWGDGNTSNGFPPGVTSDIIKAGTVIVLNNPITTTDSSTVIKYGGRDKIASTKTISVVRAGWSTGPNTLMADANEVFDTDSWGTDFRVPVGEDIPDTTDYQMFEYTGMTIMAGHGGATVNIDADNSGSYETTKSLAEGESYLVNGGVKVGAHISSDNPVQIDLITGDKASNYESRFFRLLPTNLWSSSSYTPVSTPATVGSLTCGTTVWIYNPSSSALTVQYERRTASGLTTSSLSVPSNGYIKQVLTDGYGAHFYTTGNKFYALSTTDSTSSTSSNNQAWDWGFTLVPEDSLTSQLLIGLGIGRDPTSGTNPNENGNPVWVTPIGNGNNPVTIYVDYDADPTTGSFTDPNGNKYDKSYSLLECERAKVYKSSGDQTGMLLYTLDGTKLAGAWGQDPSAASAAAPGLDLGTGVPPTPLFDAGKTATLSEDRDNDGYVSPGDVILYTIVINNIARLPVSDILLQDSLPVDVSYVADSTTLYKSFTGTTTSITDSGSTAFPLDEGGIILDSNTALPVRQSYTVTFKVTIKNFVNLTPGVAQIVNTGYVSSDGVKTPFETRTPLYGSIGDFVWADIDGDGIQDADELGVANVTVNLLDGSGNLVFDVYGNTMTTLTNATGFYKFVGLLPGNYSVQFIKPAGYNFSLQDQGTNDTLDSDADPATGRTNAITLSAGETNNMMDAGLFNSIPKIGLEKSTNGEDADNAPGPYVGIGSTVTWTYNVTNTGNVNLTSVVVSDNMGVIPAYVSGDNGNSILEVGESWIYNATGVATAGQYANIGNVTADYKGTPVTDEDPSHYFGSSTAIDIEKSTNGEDADNAPGPYIGIGSTVTWTYNVTNTGNVNLTNVVVTDNILGVTPVYLSGDNGNSILEVGESWIYNATGVAVAGQYANIGNVTADYKGTPVTDEDPSHYFGSTSAIDIEKSTNGEDADNAPGPYVGIGSTVTWTYNVTNTGNVNLTSVVVSDNMGVIPTYVSGDNGNSILEVGESWIYNATGVATAGQYANIGNVTADYKGTPVTDEDPSHYFGSSTAIDIEKYTNGEDADNAPGPYVGIGSTVTWTYNVTNTGNVNLTSVVVSDNMGVTPVYLSGDNGNSILEVGESWIYNATGVATAGQYANIGNVTADYKGTPVTDEDPSHYFGLSGAIDIEKYVWKGTGWEDADTVTGPSLSSGPVKFKIIVTNIGNVALTGISVIDSKYGPITLSTTTLGVGNSTEAEYNMTWASGQQVNTATVEGYYDSTKYTDSDDAHYYGPVSLQAQYDNRLRESSSCVVFSKATYLDVGKNVSRSRDVLWFDLSKFNKTDVVSKATLSLFWYYPEAATRKYDTIVDIYRPISWDQKYVTWYYISQSKKWPIVGGTWYDKNNVSQGSTPYGSVTFPAGKVPDNKYYEFDVTQLVQEYINGKYKNTGFFLKARMENGNYIAFYSSDWPNADQRPKLTVSLANGSTPATPAVVDTPPVANAGADQSVTLGSTVSFDGSSSTDDKNIMSYSWNFGDSTTSDSTIATANHAYTTAGTYTVNLTVTDTIGQKDSDTLQVVVSASSTPTGASSSYMAVADNRLRQTSPSTVYSTTNYLDVGKGASSSRDVILFDLSAYNKTDTISKATLSLYWYYPSGASRTSDTVVQIYRPAEWDPKYVSWNNRMNGISWSKAGGDWYDQNGISQGSTPYASLAFSAKTVPGNKYYEFDVTKLVQQYINGTYKNTGFFIKAGTESGNYIAFYSSEYSNAVMRPKLTVTR